MPSTYAHRCFGRQVLAALPQEMQQLLRPGAESVFHRAARPRYSVFDHPLLGRVSRLGHRMHKKKAARPSSAPRRSWPRWSFRRRKRRISMVFLCHFALDRACHGYIAEQIARSGVAHTEIEVEFDRSLLVQAGLDPIRTSLTGHLHASARGRDGGAAAGRADAPADGRAIRTFLRGNALFLAPGRAKRTRRCIPACALPARTTACTA